MKEKKRFTLKGFTLVELLVAIIILGLLITIGYIGSKNVLERASDSYYHNQEDMLLIAGKEYFADYRSELPEEVGNTASVTLETLIDQRYIDSIKDRNENDCNFKESTVVVQKVTETDYQYYVTLVCDNSNYQTKGDETDPIITFDPNKKSSQSSITVKMKVTDNEEVQSVRYVITKEGETYKDSGYQAYKGDINITLTELGLYDITGYAIDSFGNITSKKSGKYSIYKGIDCSNVTFSSNNESATNKEIDVKITVPNNTYKWELNRSINGGEYEQINSYIGNQSSNIILSEEGSQKLKVVVYDSDGNSCSSISNEYKIDKTPPSCPTIFASVGEKTWTNQDITFTFDFTDDTSKWRWYTGNVGSSWTDYGEKNITTKTTTISGEGQRTIKVRVYDSVGNYRDCFSSNQYYIDKTKPTCSVNFSGSANSNGWRKSNTTVSLSTSDNVGVSSKGLTTSTSATYNNTTSASQGNTSVSGTTWRGYVKDAAGNTNSCSNTVKVDTIGPTVSYVLMRQDDNGKVFATDYNGAYFENGITSTKSNFVYYLLTAGDSRKYYANATTIDNNNGSGVSTVQICNSNGTSCVNNNKGITVTGSPGSITNKIVKVTDKAGNTTIFPFSVKIYTECQEWFILNYCNALGRYGDYVGINVHKDIYFSHVSGNTQSTIHSFITGQGVTYRTKEYAMIGIYWDMYTSTLEARKLCGLSPTQWGNECIVRHWYYTMLRRAPENTAVVTARVNDIGITEWTTYFGERDLPKQDYTKYPTLVNNFIAVARAEGVLNRVNTGNWTVASCSFDDVGGL